MVEAVILHIGMHKTGSTSIQNALAGYDDGTTFYPDLGHRNHSIPLYTGYSSDYRDYHIWTRAGKTADEIDQLRKGARESVRRAVGREDRRRLIVSGEDVGKIDETGIEDLVADLKGEGRHVTVVCYVRDPLSFAASTFQQALKGGLAEIPAPISPRYRPRLETFLRLLGRDNIIVLPYEGANPEAGSVVDTFFGMFSLKIPEQEIRLNRSLSLPAAKLIYKLNLTSPLLKGDEMLVEAQRDTVNAVSSHFAEGNQIDPAIFSAITDYEDVDFLASEFDIHYASPDGSRGEGSARSLSDALADIDGDTEDRLRRLMSDLGIPNHFRTLEECLVRIHYHFIGVAQARRSDGESEMRAKLRDVSRRLDTRKAECRDLQKENADLARDLEEARRRGGAPVSERVAAWARKIRGK